MMEEQLRNPAPDPSVALASLSLLSFLTLSPSPSLVLRIAPHLEALRHRQYLSQSPVHSPAWSSSTHRPRSEGSTENGENNADLLGGLEHLSMRTPSARSVTVTDDYFSLSTGGGPASFI